MISNPNIQDGHVVFQFKRLFNIFWVLNWLQSIASEINSKYLRSQKILKSLQFKGHDPPAGAFSAMFLIAPWAGFSCLPPDRIDIFTVPKFNVLRPFSQANLIMSSAWWRERLFPYPGSRGKCTHLTMPSINSITKEVNETDQFCPCVFLGDKTCLQASLAAAPCHCQKPLSCLP